MRKIAIHLKNIVIIALQRPLETCNISRSESQLTLALNHMQTLRELRLTLTHNRGRAIGRAIVDNEHIELAVESHHGVNHTRDILYLVVGRYYDKFFHISSLILLLLVREILRLNV